MLRRKLGSFPAMAGVLAILLWSCAIEEDLRISGDGSGTYRIKVSMPKEFGDFGDLRQKAESEAFHVEQQGETEKERFIVLRKDFTSVSSLSDNNNRFELAATEAGFLRREYRFRATLQSVGFGSYKRHIVIAMPGGVKTATAGEVDGSRVSWDATNGGTIEIAAAGFYLPLSQSQRVSAAAVALAGAAFWAAKRRRQPGVPVSEG